MKFSRLPRLVVCGAAFVAVFWFYGWTAGSPRVLSAPRQPDYYNLLVDGFQKGSLAMDVTPDPWLGVDNTKAKHYLLDASFYQGRYYLYFGVTPALTLFWPWTLITGHDLPERAAACVLAAVALVLSVGWLRTLQRHFFPQTGEWFWLGAIVLLGVGTGYPVVLRRPAFYEIAIFSGVLWSMAALWCLTLAILRQAQVVRWLAWASLCAGLAAGSRPTLIPGAVLAIAGVTFHLWRRSRAEAGAPGWRLWLAAGLPVGLCGIALAWYNWARFGNPLEFGLHYQLGSNGNGFPFSLAALWRNLGIYYFAAPGFSWFFPFFSPASKPLGAYAEQVHGQFFVLPLFALAAWAGGRALWRRTWNRDLATVVVAMLAWSGAGLVFVGMAPVHSNRYQLDFHAVLVVAALVGLLALGGQGRGRWLARAAFAWSVVVVGFNLCTSLHVHGFFQAEHPQQYARLSRAANRLVWPLHQLAGPRLGGQEIVVKFPAGTPGALEPLLVAGGGPDMDALMIEYTSPGRGRFVFIHLGQGKVESEDFELQAGRARWLKIQLGSLYPPAGHPWYDALPLDMACATNRVAVEVDGKKILDRDVVCFPASANQVTLGQRAGFPIGAERFTGEIARVRGLKADLAWLQSLPAMSGAIRLRLLLPRDRFGAEEPLVLAGEPGRAECVSISYVREGCVRFALWHDGWSAPVYSAEVAWDYLQPLEVGINISSLRAGAARGKTGDDGVTVEVDGRIVLAREYQPHPARPAQILVGCAPWPVMSSRAMFGGRILSEMIEDPDEAPLRRVKRALVAGQPVEFRLVLPGSVGNQPIFTTGRTGAGDGLYLEYLSATEIRFGFDHWGSQPLLSAPLTIAPGEMHRLTVELGTRLSARTTAPGRLKVRFDGQTVFDQAVVLFPADADQAFFGANPIGMSTSRPAFAGQLEFSAGARPAALEH